MHAVRFCEHIGLRLLILKGLSGDLVLQDVNATRDAGFHGSLLQYLADSKAFIIITCIFSIGQRAKERTCKERLQGQQRCNGGFCWPKRPHHRYETSALKALSEHHAWHCGYASLACTGANTGIGFETAKALAAQGYATVMACRDINKARAARDKIK